MSLFPVSHVCQWVLPLSSALNPQPTQLHPFIKEPMGTGKPIVNPGGFFFVNLLTPAPLPSTCRSVAVTPLSQTEFVTPVTPGDVTNHKCSMLSLDEEQHSGGFLLGTHSHTGALILQFTLEDNFSARYHSFCFVFLYFWNCVCLTCFTSFFLLMQGFWDVPFFPKDFLKIVFRNAVVFIKTSKFSKSALICTHSKFCTKAGSNIQSLFFSRRLSSFKLLKHNELIVCCWLTKKTSMTYWLLAQLKDIRVT